MRKRSKIFSSSQSQATLDLNVLRRIENERCGLLVDESLADCGGEAKVEM